MSTTMSPTYLRNKIRDEFLLTNKIYIKPFQKAVVYSYVLKLTSWLYYTNKTLFILSLITLGFMHLRVGAHKT
jgi:hypothetical protein